MSKNKKVEYILKGVKWIVIPIVSSAMIFLPSIFGFIGLSSIGPISGGLFSTMQGAGVVSGSLMAAVQSFAMSGWVVVIQLFAIIGWSIVSILTFIKKYFYNNRRL